MLIASIITIVLALTDGDSGAPGLALRPTSTLGSAAPTPISRSELMAKYAKIAPMDRSATPETIDEIAVKMCDLLDTGTTTDRVISAATDVYGANTTQVIQLLVSYKCPAHLKDFK